MATKEIKWGQRCIARRFDNCNEIRGKYIDKECIVVATEKYKEDLVVAFEDGIWMFWPISAIEPIPETNSVWWPVKGEKVLHEGKVRIVQGIDSVYTHLLDSEQWVSIKELLPVPDLQEITPEEAIALLEQHTGQSYKIKGV